MKTIRLVIPGDPIEQKRARACIRGKRAAVYSTQQKEVRDFQVKALEQFRGKPLTGPLAVMMFFYMKRPKSHYGTGRNARALKKSAPKHHVKTPDSSNLVKFAEDCLNGCVWKDDAQIVDSYGFKRYAEYGEPETIIDIREL